MTLLKLPIIAVDGRTITDDVHGTPLTAHRLLKLCHLKFVHSSTPTCTGILSTCGTIYQCGTILM